MSERNYYEVVKRKIEKLFKDKGRDTYLEITADKFSNKLKDKIPDNKHIIFSFLGRKGVLPDITGFIKEKSPDKFIVIEVKDEKIKLDDIYQLRKYADLFEAKFPFLVSTEEIPTEIKKLSKVILHTLLRAYPLPNLTLVFFDKCKEKFVDWFEENPFEKTIYWG